MLETSSPSPSAYYLKSVNSKWLYAGESNYEDHNSVYCETSERSMSGFRREGGDDEFEISLVDEKPGASKRSRMYLAIKKDRRDRITGHPVMEVGGGESVKCKIEGDKIRILSPERGYLGFNKRAEVAVFVEDGTKEKPGVCLEFTWSEPLKFDKDGNVMRTVKGDDPGPPRPLNIPNSNKVKGSESAGTTTTSSPNSNKK